jgi:large subunit ribosomal protein L22
MIVTSKARLRFSSIPHRKMRIVADLVKGMPVEKALDTLTFTRRAAAYHIAKVIRSAAANALSKEGTERLHPEDLKVKTISVDQAPSMKRIRFQSMGRVFRYRKRHSHLTVVVEGKMMAPKKVAGKAVKGEGADTVVEKKAAVKEVKAPRTARPAAKAPAKKSAKK